MNDEVYDLIVARPAARAISDVLPENVAAAVLDFVTGALIENPHRVGRELRRELAGISFGDDSIPQRNATGLSGCFALLMRI
jgi:hypothetical protein